MWNSLRPSMIRCALLVAKSITNSRHWRENPIFTIRIFLVKFLRRVLDSVQHNAIANSNRTARSTKCQFGHQCVSKREGSGRGEATKEQKGLVNSD